MEVEMIEFGTLPMFTDLERHEMIEDMLSEHVCYVSFTKIDGSIRNIKCTLRSDVILENYNPTNNSNISKPKNQTTIAAFLPDEKVWRSFRVANVISISNVEQST